MMRWAFDNGRTLWCAVMVVSLFGGGIEAAEVDPEVKAAMTCAITAMSG